jgi:succinate dehydrogenase / fumarate reductase, iron-sulfur subunit
LKFDLQVWRQDDPASGGKFVDYQIDEISPDMSFLEMLDILNVGLVRRGQPAVEFEHDCREGICGSCSLTINGNPHGPDTGTATCQLHMRRFKDGQKITIEPWRARAFPVIRDLTTDRSAFDRIMAAGGFVSVNTGNAVEANDLLIGKDRVERAMDAAACIGCGACVAACKNSSAMLFVSAKVSHLAELPQGQPERKSRAVKMVAQMDKEGFGACSNTGACEAACPKEIKVTNIARLSREVFRGRWLAKD